MYSHPESGAAGSSLAAPPETPLKENLHELRGSHPTAYGLIGGEPGIQAFVSRLYGIMASKPEAENIWKWHPPDIDEVKARLTAFLSGWLGGPMLYPQDFGPPMMRRRHMAFPMAPRSATSGSAARGKRWPKPCRRRNYGSCWTRR